MNEHPAVTIYGNDSCAYCGAARMLFTKKGVQFADVLVSDDAAQFRKMQELTGQSSVPQVFIGETLVGGFEELCALDKSGELDELLSGV